MSVMPRLVKKSMSYFAFIGHSHLHEDDRGLLVLCHQIREFIKQIGDVMRPR